MEKPYWQVYAQCSPPLTSVPPPLPHTLVSPARTSTSVSSHIFCSVLRLWCISILTDRPSAGTVQHQEG